MEYQPALREQTDDGASADREADVPAANPPDILEGDFVGDFANRYPHDILQTLLKDRTAGRNILWADGEYENLGPAYAQTAEIIPDLVTGPNAGVVKPRVQKESERQSLRTKTRAEVFTPSWLCNQMNNYLDEEWFGRSDVFNVAGDQAWEPTAEPVAFPQEKGRGWQSYVASTRLEITCGEAPFICSRYDTVTGARIPVAARVGFLDRKLRVVSEKTKTRATWTKWALEALKATYGFEYQGDNLLMARINVFETFVEHAVDRWGSAPDESELRQAAEIVSWNLWQMDGLTQCVPFGESKPDAEQLSLFDLFDSDDTKGEAVPGDCALRNWANGETVEYRAIGKDGCSMKKFDFVIGNPPYQETLEGTSDKPIFNFFMDESYKIGEKVELITPARFLFNAGKTPKEWNWKMLNDVHLQVLDYAQVSSSVFPNTDIKGGWP